MAEKRLYEVTALGYVMAVTAEEALKVFQRDARASQLSLVAVQAGCVEPDWEDTIPYGEQQDRTCGRILQAQQEEQDATEVGTSIDPNQMRLLEDAS